MLPAVLSKLALHVGIDDAGSHSQERYIRFLVRRRATKAVQCGSEHRSLDTCHLCRLVLLTLRHCTRPRLHSCQLLHPTM